MSELLAIFLPLIIIIGIGIYGWLSFWRYWDDYRTEPLGMLAMSAAWGAVFSYFLIFMTGECSPTAVSFGFFAGIIVLEEFTKNFALVNAIECVGKRFEERNDGIIYGCATALGFVFVETIFYLYHASDFWAVYWGRLIYTAPAHMVFTGIFGMYYARAYLSEAITGVGRRRRQPPYAILGSLLQASIAHVPEQKRTFLRVHSAILRQIVRTLSLHITRSHLIWNKPTRGHWSGEILMEGSLLAFYLHLLYSYLLTVDSAPLRIVSLAGILVIFVLLWLRFLQLEERHARTLPPNRKIAKTKLARKPQKKLARKK